MNDLSPEQQTIFDCVKQRENTIVDACAGTGKTTLILATAKKLPRRSFLQMTYNSMLRHEVKERVKAAGLKNLQIHTFHSLAVKYYYPTAYTDTGIRYILCNSLPPLIPIEKFDVLVLDEAQDMTFLYFQFMTKLIQDMGNQVQLLVLGDFMQGLYEFKGADTRFLTLASQIWRTHPTLRTRKFSHCTMKMSYRITNQMCVFVNKVLLGEDRMEACRDGANVFYVTNTKYNIERIVFGEITKLLEAGAKPGDFFILGGSVKGVNSNIRQLENSLVERNIPCHVPMLESDKIDERVIEGKVVFSSFHCVKVRQRKYVFVMNFDNSYLRFFARNLPRDICPNTLYVACTRATDRLYLLENNQFSTDRPLEFLKKSHVEMAQSEYIQFRGVPRTNFFENPEDEARAASLSRKHMLTPTDLIKFIPESIIEDLSARIDSVFEPITKNAWKIDIPTILETKQGFFEEVSDLNGIAIPCMYYDDLEETWGEPGSQTNVLRSIIDASIQAMKPNEHIFLKELVAKLPVKLESPSDYLYAANICTAVQETLYFKLKQIDQTEYNWLSEAMIEQCRERLRQTVGVECQNAKPRIEETIIHQSVEDQHIGIDMFLAPHFEPNTKFRFTGRVDLITDQSLWELKCTTELSLDHKLQTLLYAWLWRMQWPEDTREIKLLNIKTGEMYRVNVSLEDLNDMVLILLKGKFQEMKKKTDEEFVRDCLDSVPR